ncbi:MAG: transporter substrate-binding domain-containing protein [Gammaproteobacteria bacterium]|nr:transporter substrate-binding domain-containing protein [Gammaproteobacteria bacterium]
MIRQLRNALVMLRAGALATAPATLPAMCVSAVLAVVLGGCAGDGSAGATSGAAPASSAAVLRAGVTPNYPPLIGEVDGRFVGIEADLGAEAASGLDVRLEMVELPWEELIPALEAGEIDVIMSGMSVTAERAERVAFTRPFMKIGQMAVVRIGDAQRLGSVDALRRASGAVGFEAGTTGERFVRGSMRRATPVALDSVDAGVAALRDGRIEVFVHDAPTVWRIGSSTEYEDLIGLYWTLTDERLAWAVRKSDTGLRKALNAQLGEMIADGRLETILGRWIKVRVEVK